MLQEDFKRVVEWLESNHKREER